MSRPDLDDRFSGDELDLDVWLPYYLPHRSSRAASAATHAVRDGELVLTTPPDLGLCEDIEDRPERSGEICVAEIFGDAVRPGPADVGMSLHRFRDPSLTEEFSADPLPLDVAVDHSYAVSHVRGHPLS